MEKNMAISAVNHIINYCNRFFAVDNVQHVLKQQTKKSEKQQQKIEEKVNGRKGIKKFSLQL